MGRVRWTGAAFADRDAAFDYLSAESPTSAVEVDKRLAAIARTLEQFPHGGRTGRIKGTREYVVKDTPYIAVYAISGSEVLILRVIHHAQRWPRRL